MNSGSLIKLNLDTALHIIEIVIILSRIITVTVKLLDNTEDRCG